MKSDKTFDLVLDNFNREIAKYSSARSQLPQEFKDSLGWEITKELLRMPELDDCYGDNYDEYEDYLWYNEISSERIKDI